MSLGQHQYPHGFLINDSGASATIFHEWQTGLWTLQKTNINHYVQLDLSVRTTNNLGKIYLHAFFNMNHTQGCSEGD